MSDEAKNQIPNILPLPVSHEAKSEHLEPEVLPPTAELPAEIEESQVAVRSLAKYLNPIEATKAYGRFVKRTVKEFGVPEVTGTMSALGCAYLASRAGMGSAGMAVGGSIGESVGFYGPILRKRYKELHENTEVPYNRREAAAETIRYLLHTFALAEVIDSATRPALMFGAMEAGEDLPSPMSTPLAGVLAGKLAADHLYYGVVDPSLASYRRWHTKREAKKAAKLAANQ